MGMITRPTVDTAVVARRMLVGRVQCAMMFVGVVGGGAADGICRRTIPEHGGGASVTDEIRARAAVSARTSTRPNGPQNRTELRGMPELNFIDVVADDRQH